MTRRLLILILFCVIGIQAWAQYVPNSSQGFQFAAMYNPAFSGVDPYADLRLGYRYQWAGLEGAPKSLNLSFNMRLRQPLDLTYNTPRTSNITYLRIPKRKLIVHGFGLNVFQSTIGQIKSTGGGLNYAIHLPLSTRVRFALGVMAIIGNTKVDLDGITFHSPNDQYIQTLTNGTTKTELNVRAGGLLYTQNFYVGFSYFPVWTTGIQATELALEKPFYKGSVQAGFSFALSPAVQVKPSIIGLMQIDNKFAIDYTVKVFVQNKIWTGLSYRDIQSGAFLFGFNVNEVFAAAYSYEMSLGTFKQFNDGSHELVLSLKLNNFKNLAPYTW